MQHTDRARAARLARHRLTSGEPEGFTASQSRSISPHYSPVATSAPAGKRNDVLFALAMIERGDFNTPGSTQGPPCI